MSESSSPIPPADAGADVPAPPPPDGGRRQLVLVKDGRHFIFRFSPGDEARILQALVDLARDPESGLDWFDAAVLSHQVGQHFSKQLEQILRP
jgi:hypothetical protein